MNKQQLRRMLSLLLTLSLLFSLLVPAVSAEPGRTQPEQDGALELSAGIGAMAGLPVSPSSLALSSFLLGWGGLCVHFQSLAVTAKAGLDLKGRRRGKLLHGVLSAAVTYGAAAIFL